MKRESLDVALDPGEKGLRRPRALKALRHVFAGLEQASQSGQVRSLKDMSPEEQAEMMRLYGAKR